MTNPKILPSKLVEFVLSMLPPASACLDLGCGFGRDTVALAANGHRVTAVDRDQSVLDTLRTVLTPEQAAHVQLVKDDIGTFEIPSNSFKFINCLNVLPFLATTAAHQTIERMKRGCTSGGFLACSVFTEQDPSFESDHPFATYFKNQELRELLSDWTELFYMEKLITDQPHRGAPSVHQHAVARIVAQKPN